MGLLCHSNDLLWSGFKISVADVVLDCSIEEWHVLRHNPDGLSEGVQCDVSDILAVYQNPSLLNIVEAEKKAQDGGLAAATRANNSGFFAWWYGEADILEDWSVRVVAEGYVFKLDLTTLQGKRWSIWFVLDNVKFVLNLLKVGVLP